MKKSILVLSSIALLVLAGCGESESSSSKVPTYHVDLTLSHMGSNAVIFGSAFNDEMFEIEDQNSVKVAAVTSSMVSGFDSTQSRFSENLTATVAYQGLNLPLTYQISSYYTVDNAYTAILRDDQTIKLDSVANFGNEASYTIPETLPLLPSPLNSWPVTDFGVMMTSSSKLTTLNLSKNVVTLSNSLKDVVEIVPTSGGKIAYQSGLLIADTVTYSKTFIGVEGAFVLDSITLPEGTEAIQDCALSHPISSVSKLVLPSSLKSISSTLLNNLTNLPNLASISLAGTNSSYKVDESGVLYRTSSQNSYAMLAPFVNPIGSEASPYALTNTAATINLNFLYGHTNIPAVSLPVTTTQITLSKVLTGLSVLVLPQTDECIKTGASDLANLPSDLIVKVPSGKLSLYQAADNWSTIASQIVANA